MLKFVVPQERSRKAGLRDIPRVVWWSWKIKWAMRWPFPGMFPWASSISHCQVTDKDPLRFFVVDKEGGVSEHGVLKYSTKLRRYFGARVIINPEIVSHGKTEMQVREGCMSLPNVGKKRVKRWENVVVRYWTFLGPRTRTLHLFRAMIAQHEIDHMNGVDILGRRDKFHWKK